MTEQYSPPRRFPRLPVVVECRIEGLSGNAEARLTELSIGGGYIDTKAAFRVGDRMRCIMLLDGSEVGVSGRIIYTHPGIGFGFTFELDDMDPVAWERVTAFLSRNGA